MSETLNADRKDLPGATLRLGGSPGPLVRWSCRATGRAAVARVVQPAAAIVSRREMRKALDWRWLNA